ncbi:MAG: DUF2336 domain-containing protein [Proteobacteria bacterium]|nr:DUF2336 domain-containing protein [Pseudomonadota bacterium]
MKALKLSDFAVLKEQPTPEIRSVLAEQIAVAFNDRKFSESECHIAKEIILLLANDVEMRIRAILSNHLKENRDLPRDIALKLARDVEQVSTPMLEFSPVLTDDDLQEIIHSTRETKKLIAVARRKFLSSAVSGSLVEAGNTAAATALFSNNTADISEHSITRAFDLYNRNETVLDALIERGGLSLTVAQRFITSLTLNLQRKLTTKYGVSAPAAERLADDVRERATVELISKNGASRDHHEMTEHLGKTEQLTHSLVIRALCEGNFPLFESAMAELARIPTSNARKLLRQGSAQGFDSLYRACHLPENMMKATEVLLNSALEEEAFAGSPAFARRVVDRLMQRGYHKTIPNMPYIVQLLQAQQLSAR